MSFEDVLNRHNDHEVVIIDRFIKNRTRAVPGLYCSDCAKLIKWLSDDVAEELIQSGVKHLGMTTVDRVRLAINQGRYPRYKNFKAEDLLS